MLIPTMRTFLTPYKGLLLLVISLSLGGTLASLYLPSLNASIIDEGVSRGNTAFIRRTGGIMLAISALQAICGATSVRFGARAAMGVGRDLRAAIFADIAVVEFDLGGR